MGDHLLNIISRSNGNMPEYEGAQTVTPPESRVYTNEVESIEPNLTDVTNEISVTPPVRVEKQIPILVPERSAQVGSHVQSTAQREVFVEKTSVVTEVIEKSQHIKPTILEMDRLERNLNPPVKIFQTIQSRNTAGNLTTKAPNDRYEPRGPAALPYVEKVSLHNLIETPSQLLLPTEPAAAAAQAKSDVSYHRNQAKENKVVIRRISVEVVLPEKKPKNSEPPKRERISKETSVVAPGPGGKLTFGLGQL